MNRKLLTQAEQAAGTGFKFNLWSILRSDPDKQAEIIRNLTTTGIYSVDEARYRLDMPPCDGGAVHMIPGNYIKLEDIGAYVAARGGEGNVEN